MGHVACLWGLMQKICFFFNRDRAKLVPMDKVAGRAGGTTIVIKSKARTKIKCHASYLMLARVPNYGLQNTHFKPNKIRKRGNEANRSNASHDRYVSEGILVEFET